MPSTQSRAQATWEGDLGHGKGTVAPASGAFGELPITWAARAERSHGVTSPEELIASAHAGCFAMAFSNMLATAGTPPTKLTVSAACTFETGVGGAKITTMALEVSGQVPGLDQAKFQRIADEAKLGCPVSQALKGNVEITLKATLA